MIKRESFLLIVFVILLIVLGFSIGRKIFESNKQPGKYNSHTVTSLENLSEQLTIIVDNPDTLNFDNAENFVTHGDVPVSITEQAGRSNPFSPY